MGFLQGCGSKYTHIAGCCEAGSPTSDQDYVCPLKTGFGGGDIRGYDWWKSGSQGGPSLPDPSANHTSSTVLITEAAIDYIQRHSSGPPFFLWLAYSNIHSPHTVDKQFRDAYEGHDTATEDEKTIWGMVTELDAAVSKVLAALKASELYENTIMIYSSDNGAPSGTDSLCHWEMPEGLEKRCARNYPFRGAKGTAWEGGVRVPAFVHSPLLPTEVRGTQSKGLMHVVDWLPTLVGLAGGDVNRNRPLDGMDVWQALVEGTPTPRHEVFYNINPLCGQWQAKPPTAAIRVGAWKLMTWCYNVTGVGGAESTGPVNAPVDAGFPDFAKGPVLYNLEEDPEENVNLASSHPDRVHDLLARLEVYALTAAQPAVPLPPYQGEDYFCRDCPVHPAGTGVDVPWGPWISDDVRTLAI